MANFTHVVERTGFWTVTLDKKPIGAPDERSQPWWVLSRERRSMAVRSAVLRNGRPKRVGRPIGSAISPEMLGYKGTAQPPPRPRWLKNPTLWRGCGMSALPPKNGHRQLDRLLPKLSIGDIANLV
jgi:hypothetical protein